jgi:NitT/TauT family transport system permease protein
LLIIGSSRLAYSGFYPVLIGINSVPKAAVVPILVLWMGIGALPAITTAFLLCFFPIAVNVATGLATTEPELEDVLRSLGATRLDILWKVGIPRSLPYFFASLKVSITLAFVGAVISETLASNDGIGYLMLQAASQFRTPLMFAGVTVIAAMGIVAYLISVFIERRFTGWATRRQNVGPTGGG